MPPAYRKDKPPFRAAGAPPGVRWPHWLAVDLIWEVALSIIPRLIRLKQPVGRHTL